MEHVEPLIPGEGNQAHSEAPPVWMFGLLVLPYAMYANGFVNTVLGALLTAQGVSADRVADVVAAVTLPTSLYFLWSPLVDLWVRRRTWVAVCSILTGIVIAVALQSAKLDALAPRFLLVLGMAVVMLTSSGVGGLMAAVVPPNLKTRASAFFNAGSLGFGALSGGGLLWVSQHMARGAFGLLCGALVGFPGLLALLIAEPPVTAHGEPFSAVMRRMGREFRQTYWNRRGIPLLLMLAAPLGSGAVLSLFSAMAPTYGVSINGVALMNGVAGGLLSALGALLVGYLKLPADMRPVYAAASLLNAATLALLLLGPPRPWGYYAASILYSLTVGACYALFTSLVLQLLGASGKSGSGRYAIALSLGNAPVVYMTKLDGLGAKWFGVRGIGGMDMAVSGGVSLLFLAWFWYQRRTNVASNA